ncbi:hypothetical protein P43SY_009442 [Pythium insidiosum]|uniref:PI3K/PI4K catalytic domain-containing protein n=1 Tax=Pythium insidiosum TaxID=114742 RepID=A0AAD5LMY3_PYTIN|nr:hypothetical protein P43SY_009442 [Pythium insidiosum]
MVRRSGHVFHIDFGHFLGHFKKKFGVRRERAKFVFTPAFAAVLMADPANVEQQPEASIESVFVELCCDAFNAVRHSAQLLLDLCSVMASGELPELQDASDLDWLRRHLLPGASDDNAGEHFVRLIKKSLLSRATLLNDAAHMLKHG